MLFVITSILFLIFRLAPGDPTATIARPGLSEEARQRMLDQFGLNEPLYIQYIVYMKNLLHGNLGTSFMIGKPVFQIVLRRSLNTLSLMLPATAIAFLIGPFLGAFLAWNRKRLVDPIGLTLALVLYAVPIFWSGMMAIMIFSFKLGWLPAGGMSSPAFMPQSFLHSFFNLELLRHLILPVSVTALYLLAIPTLTMRSNMIAILGSDFIEMAKAKGLPERKVLYRHAARNCLLPIVHFAAIEVGFAFAGSVVIERVFSWPGLGLTIWQATSGHDYPLAQGSFLILAVIIIIANFLTDLSSVYVDPRFAIEGG
jgi:peptide/nickel transport system permease protein